jgi:two-component system response regulator QseB
VPRNNRPERIQRPMRILLVEDDPRLAGPVADDLRRQKHVVDVTHDGTSGRQYATSGLYDLILLDVMLPGEDGLTVCRKLRASGDQSMILMITALDAIEDKIDALDAGADDYIVKPFDLAELSARVRAVTRRSREMRPPILRYGDLILDQRAAVVAFKDQPIPLTRSEYLILETLMRNSRQLFTRQVLHEKVSKIDRNAAPESIKTHVGNLRRKLRDAGCEKDPIETVYGSGYRFTGK